MSSEQAPIVCANVSFRYQERGPLILDDVNWQVPKNSFTALIGPNGGGKTTLLNLVLGLLKPELGTVRLIGAAPKRTRHRVGYIPQRDAIDDTTPHTALDVVLSGRLRMHAWGWRYRSEDRDRALHALERVGLAEAAGKSLDKVSGGQRQRIRLARALAADAEVLILDEPLTGIDPGNEATLISLLHELNEDRTIVMVSHDVACVSRHVSHVACCNRRLTVHSADELDAERLHQLYHTHGHSHGDCRPLHHDPASCPFTPEDEVGGQQS